MRSPRPPRTATDTPARRPTHHPIVQIADTLTRVSTRAIGRWLVPVLIVVVSLSVSGGFLARELYQQRSAPPSTPLTPPTSTAFAADEQPGSRLVRLTPDAASHPYNEPVRSLLQAYFDGINLRNYERWKSAVTSEFALNKNEPTFLEDYRSTKDGGILVYRIETAPNGRLRVLLRFTSTQDPEDAPDGEPCVHWRISLPLQLENGQWKIAYGSRNEHEACAA